MIGRVPGYPSFYVDDSACEIGGKKHVILAAAAFQDEVQAIARWLEAKRGIGLRPPDEVKWNSRAIPIEKRREFVPQLNDALGIAVITEENKQEAAIRLATQIWHYCDEYKLGGFRLRFDRDIVSDWGGLRHHVSGLFPPCVSLGEADSGDEQLLQPADFLAGAIKLKVDYGLGRKDPNFMILAPSENGTNEAVEAGFYFFATLRYCLWGDVKDFGDSERPFPRKLVLGKGLVVHSSAPQEDLDKATAYLDGEYMGCIH